MTPLLNRNTPLALGKITYKQGVTVQVCSPFSSGWNPPVNVPPKPGELFKYMVARQKHYFDDTILSSMPNATMHTKHMKDLLKVHSARDIVQAIEQACYVSSYPFSTKVLRSLL